MGFKLGNLCGDMPRFSNFSRLDVYLSTVVCLGPAPFTTVFGYC